MGMPATGERVWTVEDVRRLRDERDARPSGRRVRYEVVDGELLVSPGPTLRHQYASLALVRHLDAFVRTHRIGTVYFAEADVDLDDRTGVQPDLLVAPLVGGRRPESIDDAVRLLLVVEILSPGTARYDRLKKRARYQRAGIHEYWIIDMDARVAERWRPEDERPEILGETIAWQPDGAPEPLTIDLQAYFADVWDEEGPGERDTSSTNATASPTAASAGVASSPSSSNHAADRPA